MRILFTLGVLSMCANIGAREPRILKIAQMGHPCLFKECQPVTDFKDPELHKFISDMRATFAYDDKNTAGLAAPQLHVNKRVIMYWDGYNAKDYLGSQATDDHVKLMINPSYESVDEELEYRLEGCKSLDGLAVDVPRYKRVLVKWQDLKENWHEKVFEDRVARCLQHEIDHIDGILCILRADSLKRIAEVKGRRCFLEEAGIERPCEHKKINSIEGRKIGDYSGVSTDFGGRVLEIAKVGHPCLYKETEFVEDPTSVEIKEIIADMKSTIESYGYPFSGLAAPQVHINKNIAFFFGGFHDQRPVPMKFEPLTAMINLSVEPIGDEQEFLFERCLSSIDWAVDVPRYKRVKYRYQDEQGNWVEGEATGFTARVLQHEYDHLVGKQCFMRAKGFDRIGYCDYNKHTYMKSQDECCKPW